MGKDTEYPSAANVDKTEQARVPRVRSVVDEPNAVQMKKKSKIGRFFGYFVPDDIENVGSYIFHEVLTPLIRSAIIGTVEELVYHDGQRGGRGRSFTGTASYENYGRYANRGRNYRYWNGGDYNRYDRPSYNREESKPNVFLFKDFGQNARKKAEEAAMEMEACLNKYNIVRVLDYDDIVKIEGEPNDHRWGWTDLHGMDVRRLRDGSGYELVLPKPMPID